ncbi:OmpA family protein [Chitinophaga rhizophila]|uniref:OmpA family protein n=1 Tax=Chitinophaga rhizophila TaxID=2866212 RepID=A0ABS7G8B9_9BACT|nr:OmpA family protein [Chitinophaga rhizophila]MBW8682937.1 OmpA family protein [Chitinophaga rhizophila]
MKKLHYATGLFLLLTAVTTRAQSVIKEADKAYDNYKYAEAIGLYEKAYNKKASLHAAERLADCHRLNNNYPQAEQWYAAATGMAGSKPENLYYYARALQNNSKYAEARSRYEQYAAADKSITPEMKQTWIASCDSAISWMKTPDLLRIDNFKAVNSVTSDWSAVPYMGGLVFTSDRFTSRAPQPKKKTFFLRFDTRVKPDPLTNAWTGNDYLHLFVKPSGGDSVQLFPLHTGTGYHTGSASFTKEGNEMFFTLTRIPGKRSRSKGKATTANVEIYSSRKDATGKWSAPVAFTHNNAVAYSVGDPFITGDGMALYFASNMPGGAGGTDIYVCYRTAIGEWGPPLNLKAVNTAGNERSPALTPENVLYFSSDGRIGMGGLDIYRVKMGRSGQTDGAIRNMRYPLNSPQDDFAFGLTEAGIAYLSSNREGGSGSDDIYSVAAFSSYDTPALVKETPPAPDTINRVPVKHNDIVVAPTPVQPPAVATSKPAEKPQVPTEETVLLDIYFDLNKAAIRPEAGKQLDNLVKILNDHPDKAIDISAHTDARGDDAYNLMLSQKRADAVANYLISKGIAKDRVHAKGYGETRLLNKCGNGVSCNEQQHRMNRRTEFKLRN